MAHKRLIERIDGATAKTYIVEGSENKEQGILCRVRGIISECDTINKNNRIYERELWETVHNSESFKKGIEGRSIFGEPDHPEDRTESTIQGASHFLTEQVIEKDGKVRGEVAILNVPKGRIIHEMLKAGIRLGFSTRGDGDLVESDNGDAMKVDKESFEYYGVDFVLNPSFASAGPEPISEKSKKCIRKALTEAVEADKVDKKTAEEVRGFIGEGAVKENKMVKAIESLNNDLFAAKEKACEAQDRIKELGEQVTSLTKKLEEQKSESQKKIEELEGTTRTLSSQLKEKEEQGGKAELHYTKQIKRYVNENSKMKKSVLDLRKMIEDNQEEHDAFVEKHQLFVEKMQADKARLVKAEKLIQELTEEAKTFEEKALSRIATLKKQSKKEKLDVFRRVKMEGVDVPDSQRKLIERAGSEEEVIEVLADLRTAQSNPHYGLPYFPNSREDRKKIVEQVMEGKNKAASDDDADDLQRIAANQL